MGNLGKMGKAGNEREGVHCFPTNRGEAENRRRARQPPSPNLVNSVLIQLSITKITEFTNISEYMLTPNDFPARG